MGWFRKLLTAKDNQTPDVVRIIGFLGGVQFLVNAGWDIAVRHNAFDPVAYGTGLGLMLTAIGAALRLKHTTEPDQ